jgi:hypothetical protein
MGPRLRGDDVVMVMMVMMMTKKNRRAITALRFFIANPAY